MSRKIFKFNKIFTKPNLANAAIAGFQVAPGIADKTITLAMIFSFFAATAFANAPVFEAVDADKDGAVSIDEAAVAGIDAEHFAKLDVDQNGTLSMEEYTATIVSFK